MKRAATGTVLLTAILLTMATGGCEPTQQPDVPEETPDQLGPRPDSEQWNAIIQLHERGLKKSVIIAVYLAVYQVPGNNRTRLDTLEVDFFDMEGEKSSHLVADSGEIYDQNREGRRRVKTWGGVLLTGTEGQVVRADTLWWDEAGDRLHTDGPVQVTRDGDILNAIGFESDTQLKKMDFKEVSGSSMQGGEFVDEERGPDPAAAPETITAPPDTSRTVMADTSRAVPPDTSRTVLPDTSRAVPRDTSRTVLADTPPPAVRRVIRLP